MKNTGQNPGGQNLSGIFSPNSRYTNFPHTLQNTGIDSHIFSLPVSITGLQLVIML